LQPDEVEDPKLLDRRAKLRIAAQLGMDVARVNKFLHGFEEMCSTSVSL
jgi:signal recognition particle GTPase